MKKSFVLSCFLAQCVLSQGVDIHQYVYGLKNHNDTGSGNFYVQNMRTYKTTNGSFTQSYSKGTLIFGNNTQASGSGSVWFGGNGLQGGLVGYITANFKAQNIYLTGTTGAGNSLGTGGGAQLSFDATGAITLQDWNLSFTKAGIQHSNALFKASSIIAKNITISDHTGGQIVFEAPKIDLQAKSVELNGSTLVFKNSANIKIDALKANTARIQTTHMDGYYVSTSGEANLNQSVDAADGLATLSLGGTYSIEASASNVGKQTLVFKNLSKLTAGTLEARTWGAYGAILGFDGVRSMDIDAVTLAWHSSADTAYPTFDTSKSSGAHIHIKNLNSSGGVFQTAQNGSIQIDAITADKTKFDTIGLQAESLSWQTWKKGERDIAGSYTSRGNVLGLAGLITPDRRGLRLGGDSVDGLQARIVLQESSLEAREVLGQARFADLDFKDSQASFGNLSNEGVMRLNNASVTVGGDFQNQGNIIMDLSGAKLHPIVVGGKSNIAQGSQIQLINLASFKGLKLGEEYTLLESQAGIMGEDLFGNLAFFAKEGDPRLDGGKRIFIYNNFSVVKTKTYRSLGFRIDTLESPNPYSKYRIEHYLYQKGGDALVQNIDTKGGGVMEALQELMISKHNVIWASEEITKRSHQDLIALAAQIQDVAQRLYSLDALSCGTEMLDFANATLTDGRLAKLTLAKPSSRKEQIDAWGSGVAGTHFSSNAFGLLYGGSVGYDQLTDRSIFGAYASYGRGSQSAQLLRNVSHNAGLGLYSRFFAGKHELDFKLQGSIGWNDGALVSEDAILQALNQSFSYIAKNAKVDLNYGYALSFWSDALVLRPSLGANYSYRTTSEIEAEAPSGFENLALSTQAGDAHLMAVNLALETRGYLGASAYWWVLLEASKDVLSSNNAKDFSFAGHRFWDLAQSKSDLSLALSLGGELKLFQNAMVNFSLGSDLGFFSKDAKLAGNIGVEYAF